MREYRAIEMKSQPFQPSRNREPFNAKEMRGQHMQYVVWKTENRKNRQQAAKKSLGLITHSSIEKHIEGKKTGVEKSWLGLGLG